MKLLVIGGGGREHALAWRLAQSPRVQTIFVAPGNGGTAAHGQMRNIAITAVDELVKFAQSEKIAFTVVGPEAPLAAGVVDAFRAAGLKIFGPTKAAAQLESSKDYAKAFMVRHGIPTAAYQTFTDPAQARDYVARQGAPIVVKADGLAAGKGVVVAETVDEAHRAIDMMLGDGSFGQAGARVVIEECLQGEEASFIVMCDGRNTLALATSQDHKRLKDGDQGPNTGGMGAYSPAPIITPALHNRIMREVIQPTIAGMAKDGLPYTGFLYAGLMIGEGPDASRPLKVLEFNCRMGDPETQPIMMRIKSDLTQVFELAIAGKLDQAEIEWDRRTALGVVVAAKNYPDTPRTGDVIERLAPDTDECVTFHAGTRLEDGVLKTSGGRVLCVTVLADSVKRAQAAAYDAIAQTHFDGQQYRSDIGWRAVSAAGPSS
ncbi:phosphoribosylamine--glycine ligase [Parapusillimonas granuli]|uniref:Phosphoribosylamine--glycine ligase n=1 Tax=Parapusillimonas granuli TaxID=380911 RepID=A0A853G172_9BURK|nr:phosphoribosylamine--glycine ligase [Parapusillimonas granuli]MBB5217461.1 phosphoribosylamine--glycine ligase [Parapusillimonas granuli]MEB2401760.1 phosphoribosylamine--glycine ligase [Alcaligenaceae bacterium]NYT50047.1 phosphoribosylamine--glycine ligase [Parapusillimonas granuli]